MYILLALSETNQVILAAITAFFGMLTTIATGVVGVYMAMLNKKQDVAAIENAKVVVAAEKVETTLANATSQQGVKLTEIHDLVNSAMLEQKRMHAAKCRAAYVDNPTPINRAEAETAESIYEAHRRNQDELSARKLAAAEAASVVNIKTMDVAAEQVQVSHQPPNGGKDRPNPPPRVDPQ